MTDVHNDMLAEEDFDTVLSHDIDFTGVINFEKSFLLRGHVSGEITARGILLIDEGAVVKADISADHVIIRGMVIGNVSAVSKLEISASGNFEGNANAPEINFETGCIFNGQCSMKPPSKTA